jgi:hypothetical protein
VRSTVDLAHKQRSPAGIQTPVQWNLKETTPTACVIAQQYFSVTFTHCASIPAGRYSARLKNVVFVLLLFIYLFDGPSGRAV